MKVHFAVMNSTLAACVITGLAARLPVPSLSPSPYPSSLHAITERSGRESRETTDGWHR